MGAPWATVRRLHILAAEVQPALTVLVSPSGLGNSPRPSYLPGFIVRFTPGRLYRHGHPGPLLLIHGEAGTFIPRLASRLIQARVPSGAELSIPRPVTTTFSWPTLTDRPSPGWTRSVAGAVRVALSELRPAPETRRRIKRG